MASKTLMTAFTNCANDMKREVIQDIIKTLEVKELLTDDIKDTLMTILLDVKVNKKMKKEKKPRFSGYHLFMKDHRVVVKEQNPGIKPQELTTIVSKAWKDVSEEDKVVFTERAMKMKEESIASTNDTSDDDVIQPSVVVKEKKVTKTKNVTNEKKEKNEKKVPKEKKEKINKPPPPPESSDDEDEIDAIIENADSDIDL